MALREACRIVRASCAEAIPADDPSTATTKHSLRTIRSSSRQSPLTNRASRETPQSATTDGGFKVQDYKPGCSTPSLEIDPACGYGCGSESPLKFALFLAHVLTTAETWFFRFFFSSCSASAIAQRRLRIARGWFKRGCLTSGEREPQFCERCRSVSRSCRRSANERRGPW